MPSALPSPYDYLDHRAFLRDWFEAKKQRNPNYSHRLFARRAGASVSLLHSVIAGKRNLTPSKTAAFADAMSLRAGEARFFAQLVAFDAAQTDDERNAAFEIISTARRFREARGIEHMAFEYLSSWTAPAIRELASTRGFRADPAWLAEQMIPPITAAEAARTLAVLQRLGLLVEDGERLVPAEASVATPPEITSLAVRNYHHGMIEKARESIARFDGAERHLLAVTVSVPTGLLPRLKEEATTMMQRFMNLCDASTGEADRGPTEQVLQLNLQLFPLTRPVAPDTGEPR